MYTYTSIIVGSGPIEKNCTSFSESGYKCVPYYNCADGMVITDGGTLLGIRTDDGKPQLDPENSKCLGFIEVCCRKTNFFQEPIKENKVNMKYLLLGKYH